MSWDLRGRDESHFQRIHQGASAALASSLNTDLGPSVGHAITKKTCRASEAPRGTFRKSPLVASS